MKLNYNHIILITILSLILNQIFIQYWLAKKKDDAAIINIAGRQRMLSQRINLEYFKIVHDNASPDLLKKLFEEWQEKHLILMNGSETSNIEFPEAKQQLKDIYPNIQKIGNQLNNYQNPTKAQLQTITINQREYLEKMDVIVKSLEAKAEEKLTFIRGMEVVLMLITMLIVLAEIVYFYWPLHRQKNKAIKDLKNYNNELETILNNSNDAIIYRDLKTRKVLKGNKKLYEMIGVDSLENFSKIDTYELIAEEPISGMTKADFLKQLNISLKKEGKFESNLWIKNIKGEKIRIKLLTVLDKPKNQNPRLLSFEKDITKEYLAIEALKQKNKELEKYIESNLYLSKFAAMASHDLQAPLRTIVSFTDLFEISTTGKLSKEEKEYLAFIKKGGKNLQILIKDLLALSSIENKVTKLKKIELPALLQEICLELSTTIKEKEATILYNQLPDYVIADETKLRQIFQNLITNGIKYSKEKPIINIGGKTVENGWELWVSDNGIGIPEIYQQKIFKLFSRLHTKSEYPGTGIGLALVKKLVEQLSGSMRLVSTEGKGSTFHFTIQKLEEVPVSIEEHSINKV